MFLRFVFFFSFVSSFAQTPITLCEEKWDNGISKCGPVFYSGADLLSDNLYVNRRYDVARKDSLVYDLGSVNYLELDSLVLEMDIAVVTNAMTLELDTIGNVISKEHLIPSRPAYFPTIGVTYYQGDADVLCKWQVKFHGRLKFLNSERIRITLPADSLKKVNNLTHFTLNRTHSFMKYNSTTNNVTMPTKFVTCPSGQTERQLYNCMCDQTTDPPKCKLAYFTTTAPFSINLTIDNFVAMGYKSGVLTSVEQQNNGLANTKQVVARYDVMGREIEENITYSGILILVYSDGTRQKVFVQ